MFLFREYYGRSSVSPNSNKIKALAFLVYSNLWVGLCSAAFSYGFSTFVKTEPIPFFIFFSTILVYTGQRLYKIQYNHIRKETPRVTWMKSNLKLSFCIAIFAGIGTCVFAFHILDFGNVLKDQFGKNTFAFRGTLLAFSAIISVLYVVRIKKKNLREMPFVKVFLVVGVYITLCCILPFNNFADLARTASGGHFMFEVSAFIVTLFVFGIALLFDTADIEIDPPTQKTIPQVIGKKRSLYWSAGLVLPQVIFFLFAHSSNSLNLIILIAFMLFYIGFWNTKKESAYISFWGDTMLAFVGFLFWLL